jgi:hypothetical protein
VTGYFFQDERNGVDTDVVGIDEYGKRRKVMLHRAVAASRSLFRAVM